MSDDTTAQLTHTPSPHDLPLVFHFHDEMGYYLHKPNEELKEALRDIEGVPNATYVVKAGRVFVFEKLVKLVVENAALVGRGTSDSPLQRDDVVSLVKDAWVSPEAAVEEWGIVPEPYVLKLDKVAGRWVIWHQPFNALVPGIFESQDTAKKVLAKLLVGTAVEGDGQFSYGGQPLTLRAPLAVTSLPERPVFPSLDSTASSHAYKRLTGVEFESGFSPVSQALFEQVKELESLWEDDRVHACADASRRADAMWRMVKDLPLTALDDPTDVVPEYGRSDFEELQPLYPELSMLSAGSLYSWFDVYQLDCCHLSGWTACRDDSFLFYLLGNLVDEQFDGETAAEVGQLVAFALLRGDSLEEASSFGRRCDAYADALRFISARVADAMRFLTKDKTAVDLRGSPISTTADFFRMCRSSGGVITVTQDMASLGA